MYEENRGEFSENEELVKPIKYLLDDNNKPYAVQMYIVKNTDRYGIVEYGYYDFRTNKYSFCTDFGIIIVDCSYDLIEEIATGFFVVKQNGKYGLLRLRLWGISLKYQEPCIWDSIRLKDKHTIILKRVQEIKEYDLDDQ